VVGTTTGIIYQRDIDVVMIIVPFVPAPLGRTAMVVQVRHLAGIVNNIIVAVRRIEIPPRRTAVGGRS
jgi:hypothetical protein